MTIKTCLRCDWQGEANDRCPKCGVQPLYTVGARSEEADATAGGEPTEETLGPASTAGIDPTDTPPSATAGVEEPSWSTRSAVSLVLGALVLTASLGAWLKGSGLPSTAALPSDAPASQAPPRDGSPTALPSTPSERDPAKQDMAIVDLDGVPIRKIGGLPDEAYAPSLSPDGTTIAFLVGGTSGPQQIMEIGTDGSALREIGPRRINAGPPAWSPDGTMIAFSGEPADGPGPSFEIYVMDADGSDLRQLTETDGGFAIDPQWSPDGSTIVYSRRSGSGGMFQGDLWTASLGGEPLLTSTRESRLTSTRGSDEQPTYSPDGSRIAFSRRGMIWVMGSDGSEPHVIASGDGRGSAPRWSPDGTLLAYLEGGTGAASQGKGPFVDRLLVDQGGHLRPMVPQKVYVIEVATGERHTVGKVVTTFANAPIWWANDRLLLRRVHAPGPIARYPLLPRDPLNKGLMTIPVARADYVLDIVTGEMAPLPRAIIRSLGETADGPFAESRYAASPHGLRLAYVGTDDQGRSQIFVAGRSAGESPGVAGAGAHQVTHDPRGATDPAWSPDGTMIAYEGYGEGEVRNLFVLEVATGGSTQITDETFDLCECGLQFTLDGSSLVYTDGSSMHPEIRTVPVEGGRSTLMIGIEIGPADRRLNSASDGALSPDGSLVTFVGSESGRPGPGRFVANADGTDRRPLPGYVSSPSGTWSPDGSRIVCSNAPVSDGVILVVDVATGHASRVARGSGAIWLNERTLLVEA